MKIFIVDIGGSYKKLSENLEGQYIPFGMDHGLSLSPFDLGDGETTPSNHKIKFLLALVEMMTKEEEEKRLPRWSLWQTVSNFRFDLHSNPSGSSVAGHSTIFRLQRDEL